MSTRVLIDKYLKYLKYINILNFVSFNGTFARPEKFDTIKMERVI